MIFHIHENIRNNKLKNITKWFENIMRTNEAIKAYGRTIFCKVPIKPFMHKINRVRIRNEKKEICDKKIESDIKISGDGNFDLDEFKKCFMSNKNKDEVMIKFWETINLEKYSLWWLEYQNSEKEGNNLESAIKVKNLILEIFEKCKNKCFGVYGVYEREGDYKIRGVWLWEGKDVPQEIKESDFYERMTIKGLRCKDKEDIELINEFWTKLNKNDRVQRRFVIECNY